MELEKALDQMHQMILADTRSLLLEAMTPVARAMQRQDRLTQREAELLMVRLAVMENNLADLMKEVLQSQQPPAQVQIFRELDPSMLQPSSPNSGS
jgi:hypothetical protein